MIGVAVVTSLVLSVFGSESVIQPPRFPSTHKIEGFILLPYCEIREPFTAYYNEELQKSRIDYYGGEMKSFQDGQVEKNYKVFWAPNKDTHAVEQACLVAEGSSIQSVLPDLRNFEFVRTESCEEQTSTILSKLLKQDHQGEDKCYRFEFASSNFGRVSRYVFWASRDANNNFIPVRYLMMGYDSLLFSHFDKYEVIYTDYSTEPFDSSVFDVKTAIDRPCNSVEGSMLPNSHLFNPMKEIVSNDDSHVDQHFAHFKNEHNKTYAHETEERQRRHNFHHNMRYVNSMNRQNLSYALKLNHRADWSDSEFKLIRGRPLKKTIPSKARPFPAKLFKSRPLPDHVNWRLEGAVSPVKDQAICGSCWSFGTVGHIEGQYFLKYGKLVRFSEQQLVDCSWPEGNNGCDGGFDYLAYHYIKRYGLASDEQYGSYRAIDGKCKDKEIGDKTLKTIQDYYQLSGEDNLLKAIAYIGPISVSIDASLKSLSFYSNGVYNDKSCNNTNLDHSVLAVGYGTSHGNPYWLIKNSWSTYWGNDGYIMISRENDLCGVAHEPTYVEL